MTCWATGPEAGILLSRKESIVELAREKAMFPRVAMISYSASTSGAGSDVDKVREATETVRRLRPDIMVDGPLQYDAHDAVLASAKREYMRN